MSKCKIHPSVDAVHGQTRCTTCKANAKRYREEAKTRGSCVGHPGRDALQGTTKCQNCIDRDRDRTKAAKLGGWCPKHPSRLPKPGFSLCQQCIWRVAENNLRRDFGLTLEAYAWMEHAQNRGCAICGEGCSTGKSLAVDHNHKTGAIRGLLCALHNRAIGQLDDDPETFRRTAQYLDPRENE